MTLTTEQRDTLLWGLDIEKATLRHTPPHQWSACQRQRRVVAFLRGLLWADAGERLRGLAKGAAA